MVISIVIDSDRGHGYEHFKKKSIYDENWPHDMYLNVCVCDEFLKTANFGCMVALRAHNLVFINFFLIE